MVRYLSAVAATAVLMISPVVISTSAHADPCGVNLASAQVVSAIDRCRRTQAQIGVGLPPREVSKATSTLARRSPPP
jgi:hypothetical protein